MIQLTKTSILTSLLYIISYMIFYSILFYSTLLHFILLYSILSNPFLFYSTVLYSILLYSTLSYSIRLYSILLYPILFYSTLSYSTPLYHILFFSIPSPSITEIHARIVSISCSILCSTFCSIWILILSIARQTSVFPYWRCVLHQSSMTGVSYIPPISDILIIIVHHIMLSSTPLYSILL